MKRLFLAACAALLPLAAQAVDFEASVGASRYSTIGNMTWYQEGLPHTLDLSSAAVQVGATGAILPWLDWHADYVWLGNVRSDAIATPDDANYDPVAKACRGECVARSRFVGTGRVQGFAFTLEPHVDVNRWRFSVSGGPFLYRANWDVTVSDWIAAPGDTPHTITAHHTPAWQLGYVAGVGVSYGNLTVQYQRFFDQPKSNEAAGNFPVLWRHTDMLSLRWRF